MAGINLEPPERQPTDGQPYWEWLYRAWYRLTAAGQIAISQLFGTANRIPYGSSTGALTDSANLTFDGTKLTANTVGAFTLSGTIAGGGQQLNNIIIGTTTPLAGAFTTISATGLITSTATIGSVFTANTQGAEILVGTATALGAGGYSGFRANGTTGGFYDFMVGTVRAGSVYLNATSGLTLYSENDLITFQGASNATRWTMSSGHLLAGTDNTYDIGASGATRPRNLYLAGAATIGGAVAASNITAWTAFTVTRTGWTDVGGAPTVTGRTCQVGNIKYFQVKVVPVVSTATTAGTSYIALPATAGASSFSGDGSMMDSTTFISVGACVFDITNSRCYVPTQAATADTLTIAGWYEV